MLHVSLMINLHSLTIVNIAWISGSIKIAGWFDMLDVNITIIDWLKISLLHQDWLKVCA